ncbi:MAG: DUF192 domain-containing protein [Acidobacteriota bacterium]
MIERTGECLARVEVAATPSSRRKGLLGRDRLEPGTGLLLRPCASIHTWFMRFAIDVVFLDGERAVVKLVRDVRPFSVVWGGRAARDTLELPAGALAGVDLDIGDRLRLDD